MQSHIRKVYACLAVTCHLRFWQDDRGLLRATAVTQGGTDTEIRVSTDGVSIGNQCVQQKLWLSDNLLSIVWQFTSLFKDMIGLY